jgi:ATP synthase F0 subunit c
VELTPETWNMVGRHGGAGLALGLGGIGAAVGMGMAAAKANEAIMRQPERQGHLLRTMLIGQAVGGSPSIFALVIGLLILFLPAPASSSGPLFAAAMVGAGLCIGLGCLGSGAGCGWPAAAACEGVARNPGRATAVTSVMVISQAVAQSPSIFATVIALILLFVHLPGSGAAAIGIGIGAGLAMGASAFGPGLGSGLVGGGAVQGASAWPKSQSITLRTMLVGQAVCQTPTIFGMLIAFIMLFTMQGIEPGLVGFSKPFGASLAIGFGAIGPGVGCGFVGERTCVATAAKPHNDLLLLRSMLIGQAVAQGNAIFALIVSLAVLFAA